jgi:hypothetical protein
VISPFRAAIAYLPGSEVDRAGIFMSYPEETIDQLTWFLCILTTAFQGPVSRLAMRLCMRHKMGSLVL